MITFETCTACNGHGQYEEEDLPYGGQSSYSTVTCRRCKGAGKTSRPVTVDEARLLIKECLSEVLLAGKEKSCRIEVDHQKLTEFYHKIKHGPLKHIAWLHNEFQQFWGVDLPGEPTTGCKYCDQGNEPYFLKSVDDVAHTIEGNGGFGVAPCNRKALK